MFSMCAEKTGADDSIEFAKGAEPHSLLNQVDSIINDMWSIRSSITRRKVSLAEDIPENIQKSIDGNTSQRYIHARHVTIDTFCNVDTDSRTGDDTLDASLFENSKQKLTDATNLIMLYVDKHIAQWATSESIELTPPFPNLNDTKKPLIRSKDKKATECKWEKWAGVINSSGYQVT